jgi:hypothetical protein
MESTSLLSHFTLGCNHTIGKQHTMPSFRTAIHNSLRTAPRSPSLLSTHRHEAHPSSATRTQCGALACAVAPAVHTFLVAIAHAISAQRQSPREQNTPTTKTDVAPAAASTACPAVPCVALAVRRHNPQAVSVASTHLQAMHRHRVALGLDQRKRRGRGQHCRNNAVRGLIHVQWLWQCNTKHSCTWMEQPHAHQRS